MRGMHPRLIEHDEGAYMVEPEWKARAAEKAALEQEIQQAYRKTHSREGYALGSPEYPDNREGRRALARSWKRADR